MFKISLYVAKFAVGRRLTGWQIIIIIIACKQSTHHLILVVSVFLFLAHAAKHSWTNDQL